MQNVSTGVLSFDGTVRAYAKALRVALKDGDVEVATAIVDPGTSAFSLKLPLPANQDDVTHSVRVSAYTLDGAEAGGGESYEIVVNTRITVSCTPAVATLGAAVSCTAQNDGVGIAPFHNYEDKVSDTIAAELDEVKAGIIDGSIEVKSYLAP